MTTRTDRYLLVNRDDIVKLQRHIANALGLKIPDDRIISVNIKMGPGFESIIEVTRHELDTDLTEVDWTPLSNNIKLD